MQRAAMWLNIYGCQAVQCKLKKVLKTQQMHFYVIQPDDHIDFFASSVFKSVTSHSA